MKLSRRDWLKLTGAAAMAAALPRNLAAATAGEPYVRDAEHAGWLPRGAVELVIPG